MDIRLIIDAAASGVDNMSIDEALLQSAAHGGPSTLRFYVWKPATLSLGYFQSADARRLHSASQTLPLVRRATGGGAIVHDQELTYSFTSALQDRWQAAESLVERFHETLLATLREWGVQATLCPASDAGGSPPFLCFQRRARLDVLLDGQKICGSAQRRNRGAGLLHGSILLQRSTNAPELPGVQELSGQAISRDQLQTVWSNQLAGLLGASLHPGSLTSAEIRASQQAAKNRFGREEWNHRR